MRRAYRIVLFIIGLVVVVAAGKTTVEVRCPGWPAAGPVWADGVAVGAGGCGALQWRLAATGFVPLCDGAAVAWHPAAPEECREAAVRRIAGGATDAAWYAVVASAAGPTGCVLPACSWAFGNRTGAVTDVTTSKVTVVPTGGGEAGIAAAVVRTTATVKVYVGWTGPLQERWCTREDSCSGAGAATLTMAGCVCHCDRFATGGDCSVRYRPGDVLPSAVLGLTLAQTAPGTEAVPTVVPAGCNTTFAAAFPPPVLASLFTQMHAALLRGVPNMTWAPEPVALYSTASWRSCGRVVLAAVANATGHPAAAVGKAVASALDSVTTQATLSAAAMALTLPAGVRVESSRAFSLCPFVEGGNWTTAECNPGGVCTVPLVPYNGTALGVTATAFRRARVEVTWRNGTAAADAGARLTAVVTFAKVSPDDPLHRTATELGPWVRSCELTPGASSCVLGCPVEGSILPPTVSVALQGPILTAATDEVASVSLSVSRGPVYVPPTSLHSAADAGCGKHEGSVARYGVPVGLAAFGLIACWVYLVAVWCCRDRHPGTGPLPHRPVLRIVFCLLLTVALSLLVALSAAAMHSHMSGKTARYALWVEAHGTGSDCSACGALPHAVVSVPIDGRVHELDPVGDAALFPARTFAVAECPDREAGGPSTVLFGVGPSIETATAAPTPLPPLSTLTCAAALGPGVPLVVRGVARVAVVPIADADVRLATLRAMGDRTTPPPAPAPPVPGKLALEVAAQREAAVVAPIPSRAALRSATGAVGTPCADSVDAAALSQLNLTALGFPRVVLPDGAAPFLAGATPAVAVEAPLAGSPVAVALGGAAERWPEVLSGHSFTLMLWARLTPYTRGPVLTVGRGLSTVAVEADAAARGLSFVVRGAKGELLLRTEFNARGGAFDGAWHHVAVRRRLRSSGGAVQLFLDGDTNDDTVAEESNGEQCVPRGTGLPDLDRHGEASGAFAFIGGRGGVAVYGVTMEDSALDYGDIVGRSAEPILAAVRTEASEWRRGAVGILVVVVLLVVICAVPTVARLWRSRYAPFGVEPPQCCPGIPGQEMCVARRAVLMGLLIAGALQHVGMYLTWWRWPVEYTQPFGWTVLLALGLDTAAPAVPLGFALALRFLLALALVWFLVRRRVGDDATFRREVLVPLAHEGPLGALVPRDELPCPAKAPAPYVGPPLCGRGEDSPGVPPEVTLTASDGTRRVVLGRRSRMAFAAATAELEALPVAAVGGLRVWLADPAEPPHDTGPGGVQEIPPHVRSVFAAVVTPLLDNNTRNPPPAPQFTDAGNRARREALEEVLCRSLAALGFEGFPPYGVGAFERWVMCGARSYYGVREFASLVRFATRYHALVAGWRPFVETALRRLRRYRLLCQREVAIRGAVTVWRKRADHRRRFGEDYPGLDDVEFPHSEAEADALALRQLEEAEAQNTAHFRATTRYNTLQGARLADLLFPALGAAGLVAFADDAGDDWYTKRSHGIRALDALFGALQAAGAHDAHLWVLLEHELTDATDAGGVNCHKVATSIVTDVAREVLVWRGAQPEDIARAHAACTPGSIQRGEGGAFVFAPDEGEPMRVATGPVEAAAEPRCPEHRTPLVWPVAEYHGEAARLGLLDYDAEATTAGSCGCCDAPPATALCPVPDCGVAVPAPTGDGARGWIGRHTAAFVARRGGGWCTTARAAVVGVCCALYLPAVASALQLLSCHEAYSCAFIGCYRASFATWDFLSLAGLAAVVVLCVGIGLPLLVATVALRRKQAVCLSPAFALQDFCLGGGTTTARLVTGGEVAFADLPAHHWGAAMRRDRTLFGHFSRFHRCRYAVVGPVVPLLYRALVAVAIAASHAEDSPGAVGAVAVVELVTVAALAAVPSLLPDHWLRALYVGAGLHHLTQLGLLCESRAAAYDASGARVTANILMPVTTGVFVAAAVVLTMCSVLCTVRGACPDSTPAPSKEAQSQHQPHPQTHPPPPVARPAAHHGSVVTSLDPA